MEVIWTDEGIDSFEEAYETLLQRSPRIAARFADGVVVGLERLAVFPESAPMVPERDNPRLRQLKVGWYRLIYRITPDGLIVEALLPAGVRLPD